MNNDQLELESFLPYRLSRLAEIVSRDYSRIYRERFGITRPEWRLLATLGQYGTMTATAIGAHSSMHKTKVSRAVAALQKRRWLSRAMDEDDRRVEHLSLTKTGLVAYAELVPVAKNYEDELLHRLGGRGAKSLMAALDLIERTLAAPHTSHFQRHKGD